MSTIKITTIHQLLFRHSPVLRGPEIRSWGELIIVGACLKRDRDMIMNANEHWRNDDAGSAQAFTGPAITV
jgi:hypothetical protein